MKFLLPTGIGDAVWALHKIQAIRDKLDSGGLIDVYLTCENVNEVQTRALDFVRRFDFIDSVQMLPVGNLLGKPWVRPDGTLNYIEEGLYEFDGTQYCILIPNESLERGIRLEDWMPHYPINWDIFNHFRISKEEREYGEKLRQRIGPYAVFYLGPLHGNTINGHNRNALWKPEDWALLGKRVHYEFGLRIVAVGAPYDRNYFDRLVEPELNGTSPFWVNLIGETNLGQLFSVTSQAQFEISYQAGAGIIPTYLGTPTAIFWRPQGDSINPNEYLSFDERMASAWVPPRILAAGTHLPLIYGRHDIGYIMQEVARRGWA